MEWISVEDRLSDNGKEVLISLSWSADIALAYFSNGRWYASQEVLSIMMDVFIGDSEINEIPKYWMELPLHPNI